MRVKRTKERIVIVVFCIRGQTPEVAGLPCAGWEQAIRRAQCWLPHFEQRNPWLYFDSRKQKLYVLLDPDIDPPGVGSGLKIARREITRGKERRDGL